MSYIRNPSTLLGIKWGTISLQICNGGLQEIIIIMSCNYKRQRKYTQRSECALCVHKGILIFRYTALCCVTYRRVDYMSFFIFLKFILYEYQRNRMNNILYYTV